MKAGAEMARGAQEGRMDGARAFLGDEMEWHDVCDESAIASFGDHFLPNGQSGFESTRACLEICP